jgi:hypothetical protein
LKTELILQIDADEEIVRGDLKHLRLIW